MILTLALAGLMYLHGMSVPDPALTPGLTRPLSLATVCTTKWSRDVRHVTGTMKRLVCARYRVHACPGPRWEIDHLISRELGGADDLRNLWPQPIREARLKDRLENHLHREVCAGKLALAEAQRALQKDWRVVYEQRVR